MPNLPWRASLPFRLSLILSGAIALFWLLGTGVTLFLDYQDTRRELVGRLEAQTANRAAQESAELQGVSRDVRTLLSSWRGLSESVGSGSYLSAHYIPFDETRRDAPPRVERALAFVEAFGSGGLGNLVNTFVVMDKGIALSSANGPKHQVESQRHLSQLRGLRSQPVRDGVLWGRPYQSYNGKWCMVVAAEDAASNDLIGITVQLSMNFGLDKLDVLHEGWLAWLDGAGRALTPLPPWTPPGLPASLPDCVVPYSRRVEGVRAICTNVEPPGWRMVLFYPADVLTDRALAALPRHLPMALLVLVSLVGLLYAVLQRSLGRTLSHFVRTISPQADVSAQQRLPEAGEDELGQIACAYNRLLDVVQAQYAELEAKVAERTTALEEARYRAERASANKSEQLTSISHEIRTPLNGIVGALMLLNRTGGTASQHDLVDTALKCSGHLLEIINNLLDFSRIESGQMVVTPATLDPLELIDQAMLTVQLQALDKGLSLQTEAATSFPRQLLTDGLRLRQILINLLGNAVKFTSSGGVVLRAWSVEGRVYFSVHDTGPGIPEEKRTEVFTAFHQLDNHVSGSGLGLPIARSLARLLGGDLYLTPASRGACFQLELPLGKVCADMVPDLGPIVAPERLHEQLRAWGYQPEAGANPTLDAPELAYLPARLRQWLDPDGAPGSRLDDGDVPVSVWSLQVLVVDDVDTNRDIVGRMLRLQGHHTMEASSGEDALALGRSHVFDVVLMDMRMPGLSGGQTAALWREEANGMLDPDCPIVALTANAQPGERERLLAAGFNEYLTKPVTPAMLAHMLDFVADLQLTRGMELEPNAGCDQPILARDPDFLRRLEQDLRQRYLRLGEAVAAQDQAASLDLLHALKGLAGQAGLHLVCEAVEHWEAQLQQGAGLRKDAWQALGRLIDSVL